MQQDDISSGLKLNCKLPKRESDTITRLSWSPDGKLLAYSSVDLYPIRRSTIRIYDIEKQEVYFEKNLDAPVLGLSWSSDGWKIASGSQDNSISIWGVESEKQIRTLSGHYNDVINVAWLSDEDILASCSRDCRIIIWKAWEPYWIIEEHLDEVNDLALSPDERTLASVSSDGTVYLWDVNAKKLLKKLPQHDSKILCVLWAIDSQTLIMGFDDASIRLFNLQTEQQRRVEGHTDKVISLSLSHDGSIIASKSENGFIHFLHYDTLNTIKILDTASTSWNNNTVFNPKRPILATIERIDESIYLWDLDFDILCDVNLQVPSVNFINAKAVIVGDSGVGKSGLGIRMAEKEFRPTKSTHGAKFWRIPVPDNVAPLFFGVEDVTLELILWDFAGQEVYRLAHQLFLNDTNVALLLFDGSSLTEPFRGVPYWARVLEKQTPQATKYLVAARCDVSTVTINWNEINNILSQYRLDNYFETSAYTGEGVDLLIQHIVKNIPWQKLTLTKTPRLFQNIYKLLLEYKRSDNAVILMNDFKNAVDQRYVEQQPTQAEIDIVIKNLQTRGVVYQLEPTPKVSFILLKPELINQYAAFIIQAAWSHPRKIGAVSERDVVTGKLFFPNSFKRLNPSEEKILLESTAELLIERELCFRDMGMLVFPSQITITRPSSSIEASRSEVTYLFSGSIEAIYASLVVRLSYIEHFKRENLWKNTAEFSREKNRLGFTMTQVKEDTVELDVYFDQNVNNFDRVTFIRFITENLYAKGLNIFESIKLYCPNCECGKEIDNQKAIEARIQAGKSDVLCPYCETVVMIPLNIEEYYQKGHIDYSKQQKEFTKKANERTKQEVQEFLLDNSDKQLQDEGNRIYILHLSDIHLGTSKDALIYRNQLELDLIKNLKVHRLDYLVISGDIANYSLPEEYDAAYEMINEMVKKFGLDSDRIIVAPGNHDLNWELSKKAYNFVYQSDLPAQLQDSQKISGGDEGVLIRNEKEYQRRFEYFNQHFYEKISGGVSYPQNYADQGVLHIFPNDCLVFLVLNSCWEIDHHYRNRASINMEALSHSLEKLLDDKYNNWLKIAVWHHPVHGQEAMKNDFLEQLAEHDFKIIMYGHTHQAKNDFFRYEYKRDINLIGAGTFGAPLHEQMPSIPLQYNLLIFDTKLRNTIRVETRKKEKPDGAWSADARWGNKNNPKPRYTIQLS